MMTKDELRQFWRQKRQNISRSRRQEAEESAYKQFSETAAGHPFILSYASLEEELNTTPLNQFLCEQGKLLLPFADGLMLRIFHIHNLETQLSINSWGIREPIPSICQEVPLSKIPLVIVPGVVFDTQHHRIGYGKGYYDRFLPGLSQAKTFGLGFKEQQSITPLPIALHDHPLDEILLF